MFGMFGMSGGRMDMDRGCMKWVGWWVGWWVVRVCEGT